MAACPRCARPLARAGPRCLYCGADLPPAEAPGAAPTAPTAPAAAADPRTLLVVDQRGAPAAALAAALGLSSLEAARRAERGGYHLLRVAAPPAARDEAARLAAAGLRSVLIDEAAAREAAQPRHVDGGRRVEDVFALRVDGRELGVPTRDLLLVVRGPIQREYQSLPAARARVRTATLEPGYRFHLHRHAGGAPLELDPGDFAFTDVADAFAPSLLVMSRWFDALSPSVEVDDEFRRLPPALGAADAGAAGAVGAAAALRPPRRREAPLVLDNLAQFRFYSAWRGLVERAPRA
jgi:hypothetical protein